MESQARILAFKEIANMVGELAVDDAQSQRWLTVGAALCWAGGCRCEEAIKFEQEIVGFAARIEELGGARDIHGNKLDLARQLASGVPAEAIKRATQT